MGFGGSRFSKQRSTRLSLTGNSNLFFLLVFVFIRRARIFFFTSFGTDNREHDIFSYRHFDRTHGAKGLVMFDIRHELHARKQFLEALFSLYIYSFHLMLYNVGTD